MFTIPNKGVAASDFQSHVSSEDLGILLAGLQGLDCVLAGCAVTTAGTNLTLDVAKGAVLSNGVLFAVAAGTVTIGTADSTNPRIDLVVITSAGAKAVRAGTAASFPLPPARTTNDVVIAAVYVPASDTVIASNQIVDKRVIRTQGPILIYKTTTAETTNTTSSAIEILNKAGSGVVIPNGLALAGRMLRCRIWGNALINSGTPTLTLAILFGGTTMFADTSAVAAADADRRPWTLDFTIVAQGNSDQALTGFLIISDFSTGITAPTTGVGDAWPVAASQEASPSFGGSSAVDADAADRTLSVRWTFNVSNAANELVVEGATLELI
jgi:hypothetical protein